MHASSPSVFAQSKSHCPARALSVRLLPAAFAMLLVISHEACADTALLNTFSPGLGLLNASAYDPIDDTMWAKPQFGDFRQYTRAGTLLSTVPDSTPSDDSDFTFSLSAMNIGGTTVPAGTLLYGNGDAPGGAKLYGLNPVTGATLAQVSIPAFGRRTWRLLPPSPASHRRTITVLPR